MSKVKIQGNASGTGTLTISAPNTNTDRTIILPDEDVTLGGGGETAKAWINLNGTGTISINDSYNVSSVVDQATGRYDVNLSTSMANANYVVTCGGNYSINYNNARINSWVSSASQFRLVGHLATTAGSYDFVQVLASVFGEQ